MEELTPPLHQPSLGSLTWEVDNVSAQSSINVLPPELILKIFRWLDAKDVCQCMYVCSLWAELVRLNEEILWRPFCERKWQQKEQFAQPFSWRDALSMDIDDLNSAADRIQYVENDLKTIERSKKNNHTPMSILSLSVLGLTAIPNRIFTGTFTNLTALSFASNSLKLLPDGITSLVNLVYLDVHANYLKELPQQLSKLRNLELLNAYHNRIELLPSSIGCLTNLEALHLGHNKLTELPESIKDLKSLRRLFLFSNSLHYIPIGFSKLINLEILYFHNNINVKYIPENLTELTKLRVFSLDEHLEGIKKQLFPHLQDTEGATDLEDLDFTSFEQMSQIGLFTGRDPEGVAEEQNFLFDTGEGPASEEEGESVGSDFLTDDSEEPNTDDKEFINDDVDGSEDEIDESEYLLEEELEDMLRSENSDDQEEHGEDDLAIGSHSEEEEEEEEEEEVHDNREEPNHHADEEYDEVLGSGEEGMDYQQEEQHEEEERPSKEETPINMKRASHVDEEYDMILGSGEEGTPYQEEKDSSEEETLHKNGKLYTEEGYDIVLGSGAETPSQEEEQHDRIDEDHKKDDTHEQKTVHKNKQEGNPKKVYPTLSDDEEEGFSTILNLSTVPRETTQSEPSSDSEPDSPLLQTQPAPQGPVTVPLTLDSFGMWSLEFSGSQKVAQELPPGIMLLINTVRIIQVSQLRPRAPVTVFCEASYLTLQLATLSTRTSLFHRFSNLKLEKVKDDVVLFGSTNAPEDCRIQLQGLALKKSSKKMMLRPTVTKHLKALKGGLRLIERKKAGLLAPPLQPLKKREHLKKILSQYQQAEEPQDEEMDGQEESHKKVIETNPTSAPSQAALEVSQLLPSQPLAEDTDEDVQGLLSLMDYESESTAEAKKAEPPQATPSRSQASQEILSPVIIQSATVKELSLSKITSLSSNSVAEKKDQPKPEIANEDAETQDANETSSPPEVKQPVSNGKSQKNKSKPRDAKSNGLSSTSNLKSDLEALMKISSLKSLPQRPASAPPQANQPAAPGSPTGAIEITNHRKSLNGDVQYLVRWKTGATMWIDEKDLIGKEAYIRYKEKMTKSTGKQLTSFNKALKNTSNKNAPNAQNNNNNNNHVQANNDNNTHNNNNNVYDKDDNSLKRKAPLLKQTLFTKTSLPFRSTPPSWNYLEDDEEEIALVISKPPPVKKQKRVEFKEPEVEEEDPIESDTPQPNPLPYLPEDDIESFDSSSSPANEQDGNITIQLSTSIPTDIEAKLLKIVSMKSSTAKTCKARRASSPCYGCKTNKKCINPQNVWTHEVCCNGKDC